MPTDTPMQLGMIGLGRMGANLVRRLMRDGHHCVAYDRNPEVVKSLAAEGATGAESLADFVAKLDKPRNMWIMVPAGVVESTLEQLRPRVGPRPRLLPDDRRRGRAGAAARSHLQDHRPGPGHGRAHPRPGHG